MSVYAAGAVPGEFLPGAQAAFLTSATFAALAFVGAVTLHRAARREVAVVSAAPEEPVSEAVAA